MAGKKKIYLFFFTSWQLNYLSAFKYWWEKKVVESLAGPHMSRTCKNNEFGLCKKYFTFDLKITCFV